MKWPKGVCLGQLLGVEVRVKLTLLLMALIMVLSGNAMYFCCTMAALLLHELAHLAAARAMGVPVKEMVLMPFGAMANISLYHITTSMQMFVIAASGPAFSLLCASAVSAVQPLFAQDYPVLSAFMRENLLIAGFNLLPVMPLDGGRIFMAVLLRHCSRDAARRIPRLLGILLSAVVIGLSIWTWAKGALNIWLLMTGMYLALMVWREWRTQPEQQAMAFFKKLQPQRLNKTVTAHVYAVPWSMTVSTLAASAQPLGYHIFHILDDHGRIAATVDEGTLSQLIIDYPAQMRLEQLVKAGHIE